MWSYVVLPWGREGCCCADGVRSGPSQDRGGGQTLQVCPGVLTHPLWLGCDHALPREPMGMLMPLCLNKSRSLSCSPPSGRASPDRDCLGTSHLPWGGGRPVGPALSLSAVRESPWVLAVVVTAQSGTSRSTSTDLSALGEAQVGSGQSREWLIWRSRRARAASAEYSYLRGTVWSHSWLAHWLDSSLLCGSCDQM